MPLLFKISGLFAIFSVCVIVGFQKSFNIKKRAERLNSICRATVLLAERIRADGGEITVILPLCYAEELIHINGQSISFDEAFLEKTDIDLLNEFFEDLGFEDKETEYERTVMFSRLFENQAKEAEAKAQSLCRLYNTLGILVGIFLCIFFI